jgi:hypothetical protein
MSTNATAWQDSVVLIVSSDPKIRHFGTGFIIYQDQDTSYILTCAHVIRDVGGIDKVRIDDVEGKIVASGEEKGIDLFVLQCKGYFDKSPLILDPANKEGAPFITAGFQVFDNKDYLIRRLYGNLGKQIGLISRQGKLRIDAWDLRIDDVDFLQPGYSGSPIVHKKSGGVLGIVSHRQGEGQRGLAISIKMLPSIWPAIPTILQKAIRDFDVKLVQKEKPIPTLLPYLINRKDQILKLGRAIQKHQDKRRPLLGFIHGHEDECGDMFLMRLEQEFLPKLDPTYNRYGIKIYRFDCDIFYHKNELHEKMLTSLGEQVCDDLFASREKIAQVIAQQRCLVLLHTNMCSKDWQRGKGIDVIHGFIEFWEQWPNLPTQNHLLLVCLFFNYQQSLEKNYWLRFLKRPTLNQQVRESFEKLRLELPETIGIVLPELKSIEREQVENWARLYAGNFCDLNEFIQEIRTTFAKQAHQSMTMTTLVYELKRFLQQCCV